MGLPPEIREQVILVVPKEEVKSYQVYKLPVLAMEVSGIGATRQAICDFAYGKGDAKVLMLDDDLTFAIRRTDETSKFRTPTDDELGLVFSEVSNLLDDYIHVAISPREGGNRRTDRYVMNTRALRALAYRTDVLLDLKIDFRHMELMEDFYVQLSLLTRGYPHMSINWMVQNQGGSNSAGGCSTYRTMEKQSAAARRLQEIFPDFVNVVKKKTATAWQGREREDVIIQWKAAYEYGKSRA
jgi:hypothetical protein